MTKVKMYHATDYKNLYNIMIDGIKPGCDGVVYLAETYEDAAKFVVLRQYDKILVFEVELEESNIEEQFDHNFNFFKCKAFGYAGTISASDINFDNALVYEYYSN